MNQEKTGKFICELRKQKKLTQEELGNLIPVGREAISKWERGITTPDINSLQRLSVIFNVSIQELLAGEKKTKENKQEIEKITLDLYSTNLQKKKQIKIRTIVIIIISISFLIYYFFNTYKQIKVYTITGFNDNIDLFDGMLISTKEKIYFRLGTITPKNNKLVKNFSLYYKENGEKNLICSGGDDKNIYFTDYYGYDEYLPTKKIDKIISEIYLEITYEDNEEDTIKLNVKRDYINSNLLFFPDKKGTTPTTKTNSTYQIKPVYENVIAKIKEKFTKQDDVYTYEKLDKDSLVTAAFIENVFTFLIHKENNNIREQWNFNFKFENIEYRQIIDEKIVEQFIIQNDELTCLEGKCNDYNEKQEEFWDIIDKILQ